MMLQKTVKYRMAYFYVVRFGIKNLITMYCLKRRNVVSFNCKKWRRSICFTLRDLTAKMCHELKAGQARRICILRTVRLTTAFLCENLNQTFIIFPIMNWFRSHTTELLNTAYAYRRFFLISTVNLCQGLKRSRRFNLLDLFLIRLYAMMVHVVWRQD